MTDKEKILFDLVVNTDPIYLNEGFKVSPGRKGKIMDLENFETDFESFCEERVGSVYDIFYEDYFKRDQKISFDFENVEEVETGETTGGVPWILYFAGGDWEEPVYFFIYPNEKGLPRMYIPTRGNVFHKGLKVAYGSISDKLSDGSDEEHVEIEDIILSSGLGKGYSKKEISNVVQEISDRDIFDDIVRSLDYNTDWMKDEFEERIIGV